MQRVKSQSEFETVGQCLLDRVETRARRENYESSAIQALAREELESLECDIFYDPFVWADFMQSATVPQGRHWFSDIPLVLARNRNFYVELLCWMSATTDIHAHAFCGAFRVMQGSSLHTQYRFSADRWFSDALGLGRLECIGSEHLGRGAVREIVPGRDGLIHALFHLDSPSLTMLVRTHTTVSAKPQLGFFAPGVAIDNPGLQQDEEVRQLTRLFASVARWDPGKFESLIFAVLSRLDAPRMFQLCLTFSASFCTDDARQRLYEMVTARHGGELARALDQMLLQLQSQVQLKAARETVDDPEVRFFLALLLNVRDRTTIFELVRARFPDRDPVEACAKWLLELSRLRVSAGSFMQEVAARAEAPGYRLGSRIASRIPAENSLEVVQAWLQETERPGGDDSAVHPLLDLPELASLFRA